MRVHVVGDVEIIEDRNRYRLLIRAIGEQVSPLYSTLAAAVAAVERGERPKPLNGNGTDEPIEKEPDHVEQTGGMGEIVMGYEQLILWGLGE